MTPLRLSVIVPAHRSAQDLLRCVAALRASELPSEQWELIVVDDGSDDPLTTAAASQADRVVTLPPPASGPARARNAGALAAGADLIAFVDSDVLVHRDALQRLLGAFADPGVAAVFGSYDDRPEAPGTVSQYRNLLHHRVHQLSAGDVESFWAGLGAIRRITFQEVAGFDDSRYRRPEMEDVELGYRLRDAGHRIVLDPLIQGTHLKRWTAGGMLSSDFMRRGLPWARLLAERKMLLSPRGLSLGAGERLSAVLAVASALSLLSALLLGSIHTALLGAALFSLFGLVNLDLFSWLAVKRGAAFAIAAVPLHFLYSVNAVTALAVGAAVAVFRRRSAPTRYRPPR